MSRLVFRPGEQRTFLRKVALTFQINAEELGMMVDISVRSMRDWIGEKTLGGAQKLRKLSHLSGVPLPHILEVREEYWSGRINGKAGAIARIKKHGPPGTPEGRRKGGAISQQNRRENPEYYRKLGCTIPNTFVFPDKTSPQLAEFIGILLGDGCITNTQVQITLNSKLTRSIYCMFNHQSKLCLDTNQPSFYVKESMR